MSRILKVMTDDGLVRIHFINSTDMVETARGIHGTSPVCTAALGRALTGASLMGAMLSGEQQRLTLRINGGGPAGTVLVAADSCGNVKGYIQNPEVELPLNSRKKLDVGGAIGRDGTVYVVKDLGMKEPYSGQVPIISGEIGDDLAAYFVQSEQTPSAVSLGVLVDRDHHVRAAGGIIVQLLPGASEETIGLIEGSFAGMPPVSQLIDEGLSLEEIHEVMFSGIPTHVVEEGEAFYRCDCSEEKMTRALISLGVKELQNLIDEQPVTEVRCEFCNRTFSFSREDLRELLTKATH